jgi:predicted nucleic acid-binding protein
MTQRRILLDTGIIVAALNQRDPDHVRVVEGLSPVRASWFTTKVSSSKPVTCSERRRPPSRGSFNFVAALRCAVVPLSPSRLARAVEIVEAHPSLRLDLVDAVLCALSEELKIDELASLDRRDSLAVQRPGRPRFLVNPLASPLDPMTLMTSLADAERDLALK